jgi:hypothetical protein
MHCEHVQATSCAGAQNFFCSSVVSQKTMSAWPQAEGLIIAHEITLFEYPRLICDTDRDPELIVV